MRTDTTKLATLRELLEHDAFMRALARSLVLDAARADDVVQDAYVAALEHPPRRSGPLLGWFAAVVRNVAWKSRRGEERRSRHEVAATASDPVPSAAEVLAREEARRRVVNAVLALDEPNRSTMLLRYFQQMSHGEIAEHFGVPVETVRTRIKRSLERLREHLDREYGERGTWCVALLPFAKAAPVTAFAAAGASIAATSAAISAGVLVMSAKVKIASSVAVIVSVGLAWVFLHGRNDADEAARRARAVTMKESTPLPASADADVTTPKSAPPVAVAAKREAATPPFASAEPDARFGALRVKVLWGEDRMPAVGVNVTVLVGRRPDLYLFTSTAETDAKGECLVDAIEPGNVVVLSDRGGGARCDVVVLPGRTTDATLAIPPGTTLEGEVVDEQGTTVGDADVWVSDSGNSSHGYVLARSGADGGFSIRSVSGYRHIGARAAGRSPSLLQFVECKPGATVHLKLALRGPGGAIAGRAIDPDGKPVPHALVQAGDEDQTIWPTDGNGMPYQLLIRTETDDDGRFELAGVMPGSIPLAVRSRRFAPWRQKIDVVADETAEVDVHLETGVTLEGKVIDAAGKPLSGVDLAVGPTWQMCGSSGVSASDGTFRINHLMPGTFEVKAELVGHGATKAKLSGASGETVHWDAVIASGLDLRVRIVDENGNGVAGGSVMVDGPSDEATRGFFNSNWVESDAEGHCTITGCPKSELHVMVQFKGGDHSSADVNHIRAGGDEVIVPVNSARQLTAWIEGAVVDPDGRPASASLFACDVNHRPGYATFEASDSTTGRFKLGPFAPGTFRLQVRADGYPITDLDLGAIAANEVKDLGTLPLVRGGMLHVDVHSASGAPPEKLEAEGHATHFRELMQDYMSLSCDGATVTSRATAPGEYQIVLRASHCAPAFRTVTIRSGETTTLEVTLDSALAVTLHVPLSDDVRKRLAATGATLDARVADKDGNTVASRPFADQDGRFEWTVELGAGSYTLEGVDGDKSFGSARFEVAESNRSAATVELTLR